MIDKSPLSSPPYRTPPPAPRAIPGVSLILALALACSICPASAVMADSGAAGAERGAATLTTVAPTLSAATAALPATAVERVAGVAGKVSGVTHPLVGAKVYVVHLEDLELRQAATDERGHFLIGELPAGLYRVIAHKAGFLPAVVRLARTAADAYQFLELELAAAPPEARDKDDFWALRSEVPPDVLREIQVAQIQAGARDAGRGNARHHGMTRAAAVLTEMEAMTGIGGAGSGEGQITSGAVGIHGQVGGMRLGLEGDYWQMQPALSEAGAPSGEARGLSLSMADDDDMSVRLTSRSDRLADGPGGAGAVDFEHYRLAVTHTVGKRGRSDFIAQYTSESNLHRHGWIDPAAIPEASRSWRLEGTYTTELSERASVQTGLRYRQRESAFGFQGGDPFTLAGLSPEQERVDLFGRAGMQVQPSVLVEYGLYTTLRDGSLSLSPRGGLVVQLSDDWQALAAASRKMYEDDPGGHRDFTPAQRYVQTMGSSSDLGGDCESDESHCYRLAFSHRKSDDEIFTVGATHRRYDEIQRVYFSDDLIDRNDSLYLVPGDEMPELSVAVSRRITPSILAKLESNLAEGGGGVFYATDAEAYANQVRYLVTSLDTRFDDTATGLFIAFHRLRQDLETVDADGASVPQLEVERLELMLTQDLNVLLGMATDMALRLNMELSRGSWPFLGGENERDELRRRLLGGIAVRF